MKTRLKTKREERDTGVTCMNGEYRVRIGLHKEEIIEHLEAIVSSTQLLEYEQKLVQVYLLSFNHILIS